MWKSRKGGWNGKRGWQADTKGSAPASPYQQWANYPESPVLTENYPYQFIATYGATPYLIASTHVVWGGGSYDYRNTSGSAMKRYYYSGESWVASTSVTMLSSSYVPVEANEDIYANSALTTVHFAKTTA